jgi:predicted GIY-YIG superfamily endonuclease
VNLKNLKPDYFVCMRCPRWLPNQLPWKRKTWALFGCHEAFSRRGELARGAIWEGCPYTVEHAAAASFGKDWIVYLFECHKIPSRGTSINSLYCGITNNVWRRLLQHRKGQVKATRSAAYIEVAEIAAGFTKSEALQIEAFIKTRKAGEKCAMLGGTAWKAWLAAKKRGKSPREAYNKVVRAAHASLTERPRKELS